MKLNSTLDALKLFLSSSLIKPGFKLFFWAFLAHGYVHAVLVHWHINFVEFFHASTTCFFPNLINVLCMFNFFFKLLGFCKFNIFLFKLLFPLFHLLLFVLLLLSLSFLKNLVSNIFAYQWQNIINRRVALTAYSAKKLHLVHWKLICKFIVKTSLTYNLSTTNLHFPVIVVL